MTGLLGGFSSKPVGENDARVNQAVEVATKEIKGKHSSSATVVVESVETQVVAGTNYRLQLKATDGDASTVYNAVVYEQLPHAGGSFSLTELKAVDTPAKNGTAQDAASFAVQQLTSQSNSLYPFDLKEILAAEERREGEHTVHHLKLRLGHGPQADQTFEVEVAAQSKSYELRSSKQAN